MRLAVGRPTELVLGLAAAVALLGACDTGDGAAKQGESEPPPTTVTVPEGSGPEGRFFAVAGERSLDAGLYELRFSPMRLDRLTETSRVSAVGACPQQVVVAAAQQEVGFSDTVQAFRAGSFGPVEGLGTPKGFSPTLTADCRMAYVAVDRSTPDLANRLHLWDPKTRSDAVLYSARQLGGFDFGPDGQLAVLENTGGAAGEPIASKAIVIIAADQTPRSIPAPVADLGVLRWGASPRLAISRIDAKAILFLDPATGERSELPGWFPLAWSPDGSELLVSDAADYKTLGIVQASDLSFVRKLGTAKLGVFDVARLPADALATQAG